MCAMLSGWDVVLKLRGWMRCDALTNTGAHTLFKVCVKPLPACAVFRQPVVSEVVQLAC